MAERFTRHGQLFLDSQTGRYVTEAQYRMARQKGKQVDIFEGMAAVKERKKKKAPAAKAPAKKAPKASKGKRGKSINLHDFVTDVSARLRKQEPLRGLEWVIGPAYTAFEPGEGKEGVLLVIKFKTTTSKKGVPSLDVSCRMKRSKRSKPVSRTCRFPLVIFNEPKQPILYAQDVADAIIDKMAL